MNIFGWDYETFNITPAMQAPPPVVYTFRVNGGRPEGIHVRDPAFRRLLLQQLEDPNTTMVAHAGSFEFVVTMAYEPEWVTPLFNKLRAGTFQCTQIRTKCVRVARGDADNARYALDECMDYFKLPHELDKKDPERTKFGEYIDLPNFAALPESAKRYALGDTCVDELWHQQQMVDPAWLVDQHHQMASDISLRLTSARGMRVDLAAARRLLEETEVTLEEHKQVLLANMMLVPKKEKGVWRLSRPKEPAIAELVRAYEVMGREPPRGDVTPAALAKAYKDSGVSPPANLPAGPKASVKPKDLDEAVCRGVREALLQGNYKLDEEACLNSGSPKLLSYTRYGQADTTRGKIRRMVRAAEQGMPMQTRYEVLKATGRTSSSQGEDPEPGFAYMAYGFQSQNQARAGEEFIDAVTLKKKTKPGARECFIARDGYAIVSVDYDACEMRTWAQVCYWLFGYSDLRLILNDPKRCPHVEMGARLMDMLVEAAYALKKTDPQAFKDLRGLAKGPNFGLPGGMAWARLMDYCRLNYGVTLTVEMAQNACRVWREIYREADPYLGWVKDQVGRKYGSRGTITQFVSKRMRGNVGYTDAANGFFQGLAADLAKRSGVRLMYEAYEHKSSALYGCRPLAFIHDEWLYEVPVDQIHDAGHLMAKIMCDTAMNDYCPDVLFTAAPAAMYRWSKASGDPVFGPDGRLQVYEDWERMKKAA